MMYFGDTQELLSENRIASDRPNWSWADALATARPGARYQITDVVYSAVRARCEELGFGKGDEVRCLRNQPWALELQLADGGCVSLERDFAWFVQVEPIEQSTGVSAGAHRAY